MKTIVFALWILGIICAIGGEYEWGVATHDV